MAFLKCLRMCGVVFVLGAGLGGKLAYDQMSMQLAHVMKLVLAGNCAQPDADHQPFWFPCADFFIATKIQAVSAELDQKEAIADAQSAAVFSDLKRKDAKKRK